MYEFPYKLDNTQFFTFANMMGKKIFSFTLHFPIDGVEHYFILTG